MILCSNLNGNSCFHNDIYVQWIISLQIRLPALRSNPLSITIWFQTFSLSYTLLFLQYEHFYIKMLVMLWNIQWNMNWKELWLGKYEPLELLRILKGYCKLVWLDSTLKIWFHVKQEIVYLVTIDYLFSQKKSKCYHLVSNTEMHATIILNWWNNQSGRLLFNWILSILKQ